MQSTLNSQLASAIIADRHTRAAHHRLVRLAETTVRPPDVTGRTPVQRRFRLRRVTA
jgi:hypothetical protein